jgi:hypothetical protein
MRRISVEELGSCVMILFDVMSIAAACDDNNNNDDVDVNGYKRNLDEFIPFKYRQHIPVENIFVISNNKSSDDDKSENQVSPSLSPTSSIRGVKEENIISLYDTTWSFTNDDDDCNSEASGKKENKTVKYSNIFANLNVNVKELLQRFNDLKMVK